MVRSIERVPIRPPLQEVFVRADLKGLMEVDDNDSLIVGNTQVILKSTAQASSNPLIIYHYYANYLRKYISYVDCAIKLLQA